MLLAGIWTGTLLTSCAAILAGRQAVVLWVVTWSLLVTLAVAVVLTRRVLCR